MNKIEKGKRAVIWIGIACFVLAIASAVAGVWVMIEGIKSVSIQTTVGNVFQIVAGSILCLTTFALIWIGIYFTWVGCSIVATHGSIADGDLCKGTVNMKKCSNCGCEISIQDKACGNCGKKLDAIKKCPSCGKEIESSKKYCTECGCELNPKKVDSNLSKENVQTIEKPTVNVSEKKNKTQSIDKKAESIAPTVKTSSKKVESKKEIKEPVVAKAAVKKETSKSSSKEVETKKSVKETKTSVKKPVAANKNVIKVVKKASDVKSVTGKSSVKKSGTK